MGRLLCNMAIFDEKSDEGTALDMMASPEALGLEMSVDTPNQLGMGDYEEVAALLSILFGPDEEFPQVDDNKLMNNLYYAGDEFNLDIQCPGNMRHNAKASTEQNGQAIPKNDEWKPDVVSKMNMVKSDRDDHDFLIIAT